jgi:hypothetical protein
MDGTNFDDLAKKLSATTSRRDAVRLVGGTLTAGALAALLPGRARAAGGGNSACAHFCASVFGADTPAAAQCTSDAALHTGLCYTCGPASPGGSRPICCPTNPDGTCTSYSSATCFCCFTAGTLIALADGTSRPIEHVLVGDLVLGNRGRVNQVIEVLRPILGLRPLYALNESNYFVTAGHPFMTEEGWKAIDPAATPLEHAGLLVGQLAIGDRLLTLTAAAVPVGGGGSLHTAAVDVRIDAVALHSLVGQPADPATQLYNLRLDGNHTYFANDLLVHNK